MHNVEINKINDSGQKAPELLSLKTTWKYDDSYAYKLLDILKNDEARSISQCCVQLGIRRDTFYSWIKSQEKFKIAWELGREHMQMHYEDDAKKITEGGFGRNGSATMHKFLMSSVLKDYRERKEVHVVDDFKNFTPAQLMQEARRRLKLLPDDKLHELGFDKSHLEKMIGSTQ